MLFVCADINSSHEVAKIRTSIAFDDIPSYGGCNAGWFEIVTSNTGFNIVRAKTAVDIGYLLERKRMIVVS